MDHQSDTVGNHPSDSELLSTESIRVKYSQNVDEESKIVPTTSTAETLSEIQGLFNESQKIAYVGLCYAWIYNFKKTRFSSTIADKRALVQYEKWSLEYMEKIFVYLDFSKEERNLIQNLAFHGAQPKDLASTLIQDAKDTMAAVEIEEKSRLQRHQEALNDGIMVPNDALYIPEMPRDIRFVILSHLFLLSISDGFYDARSRALVKSVAKYLQVSLIDTIRIEFAIADQLRISVHEGEQFKHAETVVGERNKIDSRNRYLFAGLATIAGGAVIGLTAGIAAPFIGAGIGATLTTFGVTGAAGIGTFMASAGGLALIATGGVLTGGGMSGVKMMKRTRGVQEFEFLAIEDAMALILKHREKRRLDKKKKEAKGSKHSSKNSLDDKEGSTNNSKNFLVENKGQRNNSKVSLDEEKSGQSKSEHPAGNKSQKTKEAYINPIHKHTELWVKSLEDLRSESMKGLESESNQAGSVSVFQDISADSSAANLETTGRVLVEDPESEISSSSYIHKNHLTRDSNSRQTNVLITAGGWVYHDSDDHSLPFSVLERNIHGDQYSLVWETDTLLELGSSLKIVVSEIASFIVQQGIQALLLPALMAALTGPLWMLKLSYLIDNPWGNGLTKAEKVGREVLADTILGQIQGNRPVTLVGYSLGARVIYFCLEELAAKGAFGIVEDVFLFGCPVMVELKQWQAVAAVVSGRIVNGYCSNDSILAILYRASSSSWSDVAGLQPILGVEGVENVNLEEVVKGHTEYYSKMPLVLEKCGFSISDTFFEDEEDMEEQEKIEAQEQRSKINEKKLREKEEKLKRRQQKYQEKLLNEQEEVDRQLAQQLKEVALKIIEEESSADVNIGMVGFRSSTRTGDGDIPNDESVDLPFGIKEIESTLPPLSIKLNSTVRSSLDLDSSLSEPGLHSLVGSLDASSHKSINAGLGISTENIGERKTEFEYISDSEDDKRITGSYLSAPARESMKSEYFLKSPTSSSITEPSPTHTRVRHKSNNPLSPELVRNFNQ